MDYNLPTQEVMGHLLDRIMLDFQWSSCVRDTPKWVEVLSHLKNWLKLPHRWTRWLSPCQTLYDGFGYSMRTFCTLLLYLIKDRGLVGPRWIGHQLAHIVRTAMILLKPCLSRDHLIFKNGKTYKSSEEFDVGLKEKKDRMLSTFGQLLESYITSLNNVDPDNLTDFLRESARAWVDNREDAMDPHDIEFIEWLSTLPPNGELLDQAIDKTSGFQD